MDREALVGLTTAMARLGLDVVQKLEKGGMQVDGEYWEFNDALPAWSLGIAPRETDKDPLAEIREISDALEQVPKLRKIIGPFGFRLTRVDDQSYRHAKSMAAGMSQPGWIDRDLYCYRVN